MFPSFLFWITHPWVHYPKENNICTIFQFYSPVFAWTASMFPFWSRHATWTFYGKNSRDTFSLVLDTIFHIQFNKSSHCWRLQIYNYWFDKFSPFKNEILNIAEYYCLIPQSQWEMMFSTNEKSSNQ